MFTRLYRTLFARPQFARLNSTLLRLSLHGLGMLNYENPEVSGEAYLLSKWLPRHLPEVSPTLFDVGANVGNFSRLLLQAFPGGSIHAFEPHPATFEKLRDNTKADARIRCHNLALGDTTGFLQLHDRADINGSEHASLHAASITEFHHQNVTSHPVQVDTLDNIASRELVPFIHYLKIDTEGHELAVLQGASQLLSEHRIGFIQFEFNALNVYSRTFFRDFRQILAGYDLFRLLPQGLLSLSDDVITTELFAFQNILALPQPSA